MYLAGRVKNYNVLTLKLKCTLVNNVPQISHFINASMGGKWAWELQVFYTWTSNKLKYICILLSLSFSLIEFIKISSCILIRVSYILNIFSEREDSWGVVSNNYTIQYVLINYSWINEWMLVNNVQNFTNNIETSTAA